MTTLVEDYSAVTRAQEIAYVELRAPQARPAADGPGRITTSSQRVELRAGRLEVDVDPGPLLYRVLIRGQSGDWVRVTVPDTDVEVRLSTLTPEAPVDEVVGLVTAEQYAALLARVQALEAGGVVVPPDPEPVAGFAPTFTPGF